MIDAAGAVDVDAAVDRHGEHVAPALQDLEQRFDVGDVRVVTEQVPGARGVRPDHGDRARRRGAAAHRRSSTARGCRRPPTRARSACPGVRVLTWTRPTSTKGCSNRPSRNLAVSIRATAASTSAISTSPRSTAARERAAVAVGSRELDVDAGPQRECGRLLDRRDEVVVVGELADTEVVGDDAAGEPPLAAEDVGQEPSVGAARHAVEFVVRVHHGARRARRARRLRTGAGRRRAARARGDALAPS